MSRLRATRGSALAETALVLAATLALTFGIIQIGILGYLQLMCDGAALIAAHEYSLNNTTTYQTLATKPFPLVGEMYIDQKGPAAATVSVDYNESNAAAREGGVTLLRPNPSQATAHATGPTGVLGVGIASLSALDIHGAAIDPDVLMSNAFYDAADSGYAGAGAPTAFFGSRLDAPYYYASAHRLVTCTAASFGANTCPAANLSLRSLGTAEFLDRDNWSRGGWGYFSMGAPWTEMICHQNNFAGVASTVFVAVTTAAQFSAVKSSITASLGSGALSTIYGWDQAVAYGTPGSASVAWGQYPLQPAKGC